jgi:hypothetical protein
VNIKLMLLFIGLSFSVGCGDSGDSKPSGVSDGIGRALPACFDINHTKVHVKTTRSTEGGPAFSTLAKNGNPVIFFNEQFMAQIAHSDAMVMFVYEHECGHHALGHVQSGSQKQGDISQHSHFKEELEADCYSAQQLRQLGYASSSITDIIDDVYPWPKDPEHPSGKVRSKHVIECFKQAGE